MCGLSGRSHASIPGCAVSAQQRSATELLGLPRNPIRAQLIPARCRARRSRKGGGSVACWEEGAGKRTDVARPRQRKVCMVKARLPEPQSSWSHIRRQRSIGEALSWDIWQAFLVPAIAISQFSNSTVVLGYPDMPAMGGIKGTNGAPTHTASLLLCKCGITYTGVAWPTCMVTEPPYYSRWACNGFRSQLMRVMRLDRHGYKGTVTSPKAPLSGRKGGSFNRPCSKVVC